MELLASSVQPSLPDGFIATGLLGDTFASVNLNILTCETVVLENAISLQDVGLAFTMVQVDVEAQWQNGSTDQAYAFEAFATDPALADYFQTHGVEVMDAEISLSFNPQLMEASIHVQGSEWYRVQGSRAEYPPTNDIQIERRMFQTTDGGHPWLQYNETYRVYTFLDGAQVTASEGILKDFSPGQQGMLEGITQRDESAGIITFGFFAKS